MILILADGTLSVEGEQKEELMADDRDRSRIVFEQANR